MKKKKESSAHVPFRCLSRVVFRVLRKRVVSGDAYDITFSQIFIAIQTDDTRFHRSSSRSKPTTHSYDEGYETLSCYEACPHTRWHPYGSRCRHSKVWCRYLQDYPSTTTPLIQVRNGIKSNKDTMYHHLIL
jgi:hypothetical protein